MGDNEGSGSSFATGFLVGAVIGVAVGFLYAPKSGHETRELIREKAGEVREKAEEISGKAKDAASTARKKVEERLGHREAEA